VTVFVAWIIGSVLYGLFNGTMLLLLVSQLRGLKGDTMDCLEMVDNNPSTTRFKVLIGIVLIDL
jgi:hypothetical protein